MTPSPAALAPPEPAATIAVILGASQYPQKPVWSNPVLGASARAFRDYLTSASGLSLARAQVLDLFDDEADPTTQMLRIGDFLATSIGTARDLILYYVGHGGFHNDEYHLGIRCTRNHREFITTIESRKLAQLIREEFGRKRVYVILDSCFSASAANDFQADEIVAAARKMGRPLPRQGTAFLAAASRDNITRAPRGERYTVFTSAMLEALARGIDNEQPRISIYELYDEVREILRRREIDDESRPELHLPNQADGDVSRLQVFPNAAYLRAEEQRRRAEQAREDADAQARAAAAARAQRAADERAATTAGPPTATPERAATAGPPRPTPELATMFGPPLVTTERAATAGLLLATPEVATMFGPPAVTTERAATASPPPVTAELATMFGPPAVTTERATSPASRPRTEVSRARSIAARTISLILIGAILGVIVWGVSRSSDDALEIMKKYKVDLCACRDHDVDCGKRATEALNKAESDWSAKHAGEKSASGEKPDAEMGKLTSEIAECSKRVMFPDMGAAGGPAGSAVPAGSDSAASGPAPPGDVTNGSAQ